MEISGEAAGDERTLGRVLVVLEPDGPGPDRPEPDGLEPDGPELEREDTADDGAS
ncbi:hypothetical protein ABZ929_18745 [Streptomyces physcomitrii]|uniref:hypothetical protein n=1 Tax=Streptomyces physcomitrii TaxID=2724184 RepID=UPI00342ED4ED